MGLPSLSLRRPVLAIVLSIIITLFGLISYQFLGLREYPSIDPPVITVRTNYTGANAEVIESQITEPLEKSINGIQGIRSISSASNLGSSVITVEFDLSIPLEEAANDVRDKVSQAIRNLPQDIDAPPVVTKADANSDAIISMTVQSTDRTQLEVCDYATNTLLERLQTIPGVSTVQIWGEKKYAMRLWLDPLKMQARGIGFNDVVNALNKENIELPGGKVYGDQTELTVRTLGRLSTEADFMNLVIRKDESGLVRLSDLGRAEPGAENEETVLKESGVPMIALAIVPQPGSNYLEISEEFYKRYNQIRKEVPSDIRLNIALDNTVFIKRSIIEVGETIGIAFALVVLIIFLFFRDWLIAVRPLIDIPVSLIGAFFIMYLSGFTINVLTLLAIVLATGLVVDDGIVVTENIFRKLEAGMDRKTAAREGSEEIFFAVIATSLTLAVVFLPIIFLEGFVGRLFREFGVVLAAAVLISAFVSLSLTPVLSVWLTRKNSEPTRFYKFTEPFFIQLDHWYKSSLEAFLKIRWMAFVILAICFAAIGLLFKSIPQELAPLEDRGVFRLAASMPEGTSYDEMEQFVDKVTGYIMDSVPERQIVLSVTAPGFAGSGAVNTGFIRIRLKEQDQRVRTQMQLAEQVGKGMTKFKEGKAFPIQDQTISAGGAARFGLPVQFVIQHLDFNRLREKLPLFLEEAGKEPTFMGVDVNLKFNKPETVITIDRLRAAELGVSAADIAQTLQLALSGRRIGYYIMNGKQYQIISQVERSLRDEPSDLSAFTVRSSQGNLIRLDNLVSISEEANPPQLYHFNRYKSATVSAGLAPGKTIGDGIEAMNRVADKVLDDSFSTDLSGPSRDFSESSSNTSFAFLLALLLIFLVLAAQFESFVDPLVIMLTVPLALAGALFSLWYFDQTLNIFSQIGMIMLIGLVTKNGILIVEFANHKKAEGLSKKHAVIEASVLRLRPILMTSLATALGALPIAMALGAGAQSRVPLGIVVVGGISFSLILTLYVIPAVYSYFSSNSGKAV